MTDDRRITAVVLARNEAGVIGDCLASLEWADRRLVVDSGSVDATPRLAAAAGADVVVHGFENYSRQRNAALGLVGTPWTLFVDADERVTPELAREIQSVLEGDGVAGYWLPRVNTFWGRALKGGGWYPDHQLRLLRTRLASYDPDRAVHEVASVQGVTRRLTHPLIHLNYDSWGEFRARQREYAALEAQRRLAEGWVLKRWSGLTLPARALWSRLVAMGGWKDGMLGRALAAHMAWYERLTVALMRRGGSRAGHLPARMER